VARDIAGAIEADIDAYSNRQKLLEVGGFFGQPVGGRARPSHNAASSASRSHGPDQPRPVVG